MGISQSEISEFEEIKRNYGILKYNQAELMLRIDNLDIDRAAIDQNFQKQQTDLKNTIDGVKTQLRELKHGYTIGKQRMDEECTELKQRSQELQESISQLKLAELRIRRGSILKYRHV